MENIRENDDEELKSVYMKKVLSTISKANEQETAPVIIAKINKLHQKYFGAPYSFEALKKQYNILMLEKEESIWNKIQASEVKKAKECIETADVIISKGQGNFETLNGCDLNIYYLFLCKCEWFVKRFGMEQFKGVFINDRNFL